MKIHENPHSTEQVCRNADMELHFGEEAWRFNVSVVCRNVQCQRFILASGAAKSAAAKESEFDRFP